VKVLWAVADYERELNTSLYRAIMPSRLLFERLGYLSSIVHIPFLFPPHDRLAPDIRESVEGADVIVIERVLAHNILDRIKEWKAMGKRVIATFDDAYHLMPPEGLESYSTWRGGSEAVVGRLTNGEEVKGSILNQFRRGLGMVDAAMVPSKVLADDYKLYCPDIRYIPNFIDPELYKDVRPRPRDGNFVIGWGGSSAHVLSWIGSGLAQALGAICRKYPRVSFHIQASDKRILSMLDKAKVRYGAGGWMPFNQWPQEVANWDLYVMPLSGEYDRRRSSLKCIEAGLAKIPWVATNMEPYQGAMGGSLVENKSEAWVRAISGMIDSQNARSLLAKYGYEWAMNQREIALGLYQDILEGK
jgi:hypothetical protein